MAKTGVGYEWTHVTFGEVAHQVRDKVDVEKSGLKRYVAGEHMDSDDLRIRRWGLIGDGYLGPAFHMRFRPGHVLYGSRRTYLRKIAVADFEGVCANTTFVIETKDPKALLPELLPFIMQTDTFQEHSIRESKGSVNPYVNFSDLARFEFALPPLEEQQKIADVFQAGQTYSESIVGLVSKAQQLKESLLQRLLNEGIGHSNFELTEIGKIPYGWQVRTAKDTLYIKGRIGWRGLKKSEFTKTGPYLITGMHFVGNKVDWENCFHITKQRYDESPEIMVRANDILLTKDGTIGKVAFVDYLPDKASLNSHLFLLRSMREDVHPKFIFYVLLSDAFRRFVSRLQIGSTRAGLSQSNFEKFRFALPPISEQQEIVSVLATVDEQINRLGERRLLFEQLKKQLIQALLKEKTDRG